MALLHRFATGKNLAPLNDAKFAKKGSDQGIYAPA